MTRKRIVFFCLLLSFLSYMACNGGQAQQQPESLTDPPIAVETVPVAVNDIVLGISVVGTLSPKFQTQVKSEYTGIVDQVYVTEWQQVKKGDRLAKLDTREGKIMLAKAAAAVAVIRAGLAEAEVEADKARREYVRLSKLNKVGLVTQQNLDDAKTAKEAVEARIEAIKAQISAAKEEVRHARTRLGKAVIYAPIDGIVAQRTVNVGDLVGEVGSPRLMFRIVDNRILDLTCPVPSWELENIQLGQAIDFWTDAIPGKKFSGTINFINPVVDEADRSVKIIAEVQNDSGILKGGLFVKGLIRTGLRRNSLQVPKTALVNWDMDKHTATVFVVAGGRARQREIRTGDPVSDMIEVTNGLKTDEAVVVRGAFRLKDGDAISIVKG